MKREYVSMIVVLTCICIVVAGSLGYVNAVTKDKIAAIADEKMQKAMSDIMPGASFKEIALPEGSRLDRAFYAVDESGKNIGICSKVTAAGFADDIVLIVGVNDKGVVSGVRIIQINETAGLGSRTNDDNWLSQFIGLTGKITLKKAKTLATDVAAVSGATISSSAVTKGVQTALDESASLGGSSNE